MPQLHETSIAQQQLGEHRGWEPCLALIPQRLPPVLHHDHFPLCKVEAHAVLIEVETDRAAIAGEGGGGQTLLQNRRNVPEEGRYIRHAYPPGVAILVVGSAVWAKRGKQRMARPQLQAKACK